MQIMPQQENSKKVKVGNQVIVIGYELESLNRNAKCMRFGILSEYEFFGNIEDYLTDDDKVDKVKLLGHFVSGKLSVIDHFKRNDNE
jgi:hypothetical protein